MRRAFLPRLLETVLISLILTTGPMQASASHRAPQSVIDVSSFEPCDCSIIMQDSVALGGPPGGPGEIVSVGNSPVSLMILRDGSFLVWPRGGSEVKRYGADGRLLATIGREGEGPGELLVVGDVGASGERIYVTDQARSLIAVFTTDGQYIAQHRVPYFDFGLVVGRSDRVIIAARSAEGRSAGFPLHLFDLVRDSVLRSTGSLDGRYVPSPYDQPMVSEADPSSPGTVWLAQPRQFRFEHWNVETDSLEQTVGGDMSWFPSAESFFDGTAPPPTLLYDFVVDRSQRLWVLTREADPQWESNVTTVTIASGRSRVQITDRDGVWNTRMRVFDLSNRASSSGLFWDRGTFSLTLSPDGEPVLFEHVVDLQAGVERLVVRRLMLGP